MISFTTRSHRSQCLREFTGVSLGPKRHLYTPLWNNWSINLSVCVAFLSIDVRSVLVMTYREVQEGKFSVFLNFSRKLHVVVLCKEEVRKNCVPRRMKDDDNDALTLANAWNVNFENLYVSQFTLSTRLIITNHPNIKRSVVCASCRTFSKTRIIPQRGSLRNAR